MLHNKKRVSKIVDELVTYFFSLGATDINISINESKECYKIYLKGNCTKITESDGERLTFLLNTPKREDIEEYYWELTGESDINNELSLVGMMIDESKVNYIVGEALEVTLLRKKSGESHKKKILIK